MYPEARKTWALVPHPLFAVFYSILLPVQVCFKAPPKPCRHVLKRISKFGSSCLFSFHLTLRWLRSRKHTSRFQSAAGPSLTSSSPCRGQKTEDAGSWQCCLNLRGPAKKLVRKQGADAHEEAEDGPAMQAHSVQGSEALTGCGSCGVRDLTGRRVHAPSFMCWFRCPQGGVINVAPHRKRA